MIDRIREAIERKLALARAANKDRWWYAVQPETDSADDHFLEINGRFVGEVGYQEEDIRPIEAEHIAANDPASVIRACEAALRVLERHPGEVCSDHPNGASHMICIHCDGDWPCDEIGDLADAFGVNLEETA